LEYNDRPVIASVWIVVAAIIFFPLSILLILVRAILHWNMSYKKIGDIKVSGYTAIIIFCIFTSLILLVDSTNTTAQYAILVIVFAVLFLSPAAFSLLLARHKRKNLEKRYIYYCEVILVRHESSITSIAQMTKVRPKMVEHDLLRMIYLGMLEDGYIDEISGRIIFYKNLPPQNAAVVEVEADGQTKLLPKNVECSGCGSISNLKPRETLLCSYCGASLVYPA